MATKPKWLLKMVSGWLNFLFLQNIPIAYNRKLLLVNNHFVFKIFTAASKCADDRLKSYNGTCYLFVSYPEVDWFTAQQVCAGIHGELASVSTAEEQR